VSFVSPVLTEFSGMPLLASTNPPPPEPATQSPAEVFALRPPLILKPPVGGLIGASCANVFIERNKIVNRTSVYLRVNSVNLTMGKDLKVEKCL
jgi:hypothetical protein